MESHAAAGEDARRDSRRDAGATKNVLRNTKVSGWRLNWLLVLGFTAGIFIFLMDQSWRK
jgi:hypothetical protein